MAVATQPCKIHQVKFLKSHITRADKFGGLYFVLTRICKPASSPLAGPTLVMSQSTQVVVGVRQSIGHSHLHSLATFSNSTPVDPISTRSCVELGPPVLAGTKALAEAARAAIDTSFIILSMSVAVSNELIDDTKMEMRAEVGSGGTKAKGQL